MITITKHGNKPTYSGTCMNCGCSVSCSETDVQHAINSGRTPYVRCPECGGVIDLLTTSYTIPASDTVSVNKGQWVPQAGDIVRKKGENKPHYRINDNPDRILGGGDFIIMQIMDCGIAGGSVSRYTLEKEYELVERPKSLEDAFKDIFKTISETWPKTSDIEITIDGQTHVLIEDPEYETCLHCSLDEVCNRFKDSLCNAISGKDGHHIFNKKE